MFIGEVGDFVQQTVRLPATDVRLEELRVSQRNDEVLTQVRKFVHSGWPSYISAVDSVLRPYYDKQALIVELEGLLLYQNRIIIPQAERLATLKLIHDGT